MSISNTKYDHPKLHKIIWVPPYQKTFSQIDHVLFMKRKQSAMKDIRSYRHSINEGKSEKKDKKNGMLKS